MANKMILAAGSNAPMANSGLKLSKLISIKNIEKHPKFEKLYEIKTDLLDRITSNIGKNGFDNSQPVHIWITTDENGVEHFYLIDGYTRLAASEALGLTTIPYCEHRFNTIDEAYLYAIHLQTDRRNLDNANLLTSLEILMGTDYVSNSKNKIATIADELGISESTVKRGLNVIKNGTEEDKKEIKENKKSINETAKEIKKRKKQSEDIDNETDEISESLEDGAGLPAPIMINHSDGQEHISYQPTILPKEIDDERTAERNKAYELGYSEGFEKAYTLLLYWAKIGRTAEEMFNDPLLSDLSVSMLMKIELPEDAEGTVNNL